MKNRTCMVIGLALLASSIGCKTTSMSKLPGLAWLGPKDKDTSFVAADTKPSNELPPPSSAAIPNLPVKQATASQASGQPELTASAAVNTEPLKTYPATPYPNFEVSQTNASTPQNYSTGPYSTVATPVPSQNIQTMETPQTQQGFYDPNYDDSSSRRSQQPPAENYMPEYTLPPDTDGSTSSNYVAPQNQPMADSHFDPPADIPNMPVGYATPQQGNGPQHHQADPIPSTALTESNVAPVSYEAAGQTPNASHADAISTPPSYYGNAQKRSDGPWRPGSTACQDAACLASSSDDAACQDGTCAPPQIAVPQVDQPFETQANKDAMATQPAGSSSRSSFWR